MIDITIPIRPVPKGRPRMTRAGHTYTPKATADFERKVREYVGLFVKSPLLGPLAVKMEFVLVPPKMSKKRTQQAYDGLILPDKRPDLDNYEKGLLDSLNGVAYNDDAQIVKLGASKSYGPRDQIRLIIMEV